MDFDRSVLHEDIGAAMRELMEPIDDRYWMEHDRDNEFPWAFYDAVAGAGWLGITIPAEYDGGGLGVREAAIVELEISASGGGMNACSAVHIGIFGFDPVIRHGSEDLRGRFLPRVPTGDLHIAFAVAEADAGTDTSRISTSARNGPGGYRVSGQKVWITKAQQAGRMLLLARTTKRGEVSKRFDGVTLFFAEMDPERVVVREIPKLGRNAVNSNELFIDDLFVADGDVVDRVGQGFRAILCGLNAERILDSNAAIGIRRASIRRAAAHAKERVVFDRPIGQNQAIAHPLASRRCASTPPSCWYTGPPGFSATVTNAAKRPTWASSSPPTPHSSPPTMRFRHTEATVFGKEFHVERYFREARLNRLAPIGQEMVLNYLGEHVLGLPRSY